MSADFRTAEKFLQAEGRLLERRLFGALFRDEAPRGVVEVLSGYRNADGGFGHGLEPDKRWPASLTVDFGNAFQALAAIGSPELLVLACDFLSSVSKDGAV